jgi:hypothetical protein
MAQLKFFSPEFDTDPYPHYQALRNENPMHLAFGGNAWVITRYRDIKTVLEAQSLRTVDIVNQLHNKERFLKKQGKNLDTLINICNLLLFFSNLPNHTRLRKLITKAYSIKKPQIVRFYIETTVNELIAQVKRDGSMDVIKDLASPLPSLVIAKILGISEEDSKRLSHWANILSRIIDQPLSLAEYELMNETLVQFCGYLLEVIDQKKKNIQDDVISALILVEQDGDFLTTDEILTTCILLFITGEETTVNALGNGMLALLRNPDQMDKLKKQPEIITGAVEELLRYDSPVQMISRQSTETIEIAGETISPGQRIILCLGSANRDPEQFAEPDRLNLDREENQHLAFGGGIHRCLGAGLARTQIQIAINTMLDQLPELHLSTEKLEWHKRISLRSLKSLPVEFKS